MFEMDKDATEILVVLFDAMVQLADVRLIQKAQHFFLELPASLARNNLDEINFPVNRFLHNAIEFGVDLSTAIVDVVLIKFEFCHFTRLPTLSQFAPPRFFAASHPQVRVRARGAPLPTVQCLRESAKLCRVAACRCH